MGFEDTVLAGTIDYQLERHNGSVWEDTGWADRLSNIGPVTRSLGEDWSGNFEVGEWNCDLADTDYEIWGSLSSLINQKMRFAVRIDGSAWQNQFTGRVLQESVKNSVVSLSLMDFFQDIKGAHFEWDYASLNTQVHWVTGTEVHYNADAETVFRGSFCNGGTIGTGGEIVKFSLGDFSYPIQDELANETALLVKSATWTNQDLGIIRFSVKPDTVGSGWYSYIRTDLIFSGNPGQVIYDILTGTNTNLEWPDSDFDKTLWGAGTDSTILFDFAGTIEGDETPEPGQVLQEIKEICKSSLSDIWFNADGEFSWSAWRPRFEESLYHFREGSQINDVKWTSDINDIYTRVVVRYAFQSSGDAQYGAIVSRTFEETATNFNFLDRTGTIETKWIDNIDEAAVVRDRIGIRRKKGIPRVDFQSSLFAMVGTLDSLIDVTARSGSLGTAPFQIRKLTKNFQTSQIGIVADDFKKLYENKGFARWEDGEVDGDEVPNDAEGSSMVSGTSRSGWSWFNSDGNQVALTVSGKDAVDTTLVFSPSGKIAVGDYITTAPNSGNNWEIMAASSLISPGNMLVTRGVESTIAIAYGSGNPIYMCGSLMPPMQWLSGKIQGTNAGTVRNIDADKYGTIFRWF